LRRDFPASPGDIFSLSADNRLSGKYDVESAAIMIDPEIGGIIALTGSYDAMVSSFDRSLSLRQPGSAIKPFLWATALELGVSPSAYIDNRRRVFQIGAQTWSPQNYDQSESGPVLLYRALERSLNIPAVNLVELVGTENMSYVGRLTGVYRNAPMSLAMASALGASDTDLRSLTMGYASFVNNGVSQEPFLISRIISDSGELLYTRDVDPGTEALSLGTAQDILSMLYGATQRGTSASALSQAALPIAGKTGTTQDHRDAWFIGVTPEFSLGVWIGRDDNTRIAQGATGGAYAAPAVREILADIHQKGLFREAAAAEFWPPQLMGTERIATAPPPQPEMTSGYWDQDPNNPYNRPRSTGENPFDNTQSQGENPFDQGSGGFFQQIDRGVHLRPW
jgi:penicillin-binding protein 1A